MEWASLKVLATKTIHRRDIDWEGLQQVAFDEIDQRLVVMENEAYGEIGSPVHEGRLWAFDLPADYARMRSCYRGARALVPVPMRDMLLIGDNAGAYAVSDRKVYVKSESPLTITYTRKARLASEGEPETPMLRFYSNIVLYALLKHGAIQAVDTDKADVYENQLGLAIDGANAFYLDAAFGAGMSPVIPGGNV